jgi:hypothetical protein
VDATAVKVILFQPIPAVSIVQEPVNTNVLAEVLIVPAIYFIVLLLYLKLLTKVVLAELISILLVMLPDQVAGKLTVPVPTRIIFVVPVTIPLVRVVLVKELVFIVPAFNVGPVLVPPRFKVPVLTTKAPDIVRVLVPATKKVPLAFKLDAKVSVRVVVVVIPAQSKVPVFNVVEFVNTNVHAEASIVPAIYVIVPV